jgi:hypothetical protein
MLKKEKDVEDEKKSNKEKQKRGLQEEKDK